MKTLYYIVATLLLFIGCSSDEDGARHNNINDYQGVWIDTIFDNGKIYIEEAVIRDHSIYYSFYDKRSLVVLDTMSGNVILGNEDRVSWDCICPITNTNRRIIWNVMNLTQYQMHLFSNILGDHDFKKNYHPSLEQYAINDTLQELLQYSNYLPLQKEDFLSQFGINNQLESVNEMDASYYIHHPLFSNITFNGNYECDSIRSYTLTIKDTGWYKCDSIVKSCFTLLRRVNGTAEYIDADLLENAHNVIVVDSVVHSIQFLSINDYDHWPNGIQFVGKTFQYVDSDLGEKYVYLYHEDRDAGSFEYSYQTNKDSLCNSIVIITDASGYVQSCSVSLLKQYMRTRIKDAKDEEKRMALLLKKKYRLSRVETDENGNDVYYFCPYADTKYEIVLRIKYYLNDISKLCCVTIDYNLI